MKYGDTTIYVLGSNGGRTGYEFTRVTFVASFLTAPFSDTGVVDVSDVGCIADVPRDRSCSTDSMDVAPTRCHSPSRLSRGMRTGPSEAIGCICFAMVECGQIWRVSVEAEIVS